MASAFPKTVKAGGKALEVNPLDPGEMLDFFESFTARQVSSRAWFRYALWICSVRSVNGVPVQFPRNGQEVKDLAKSIGHEGVLAVQEAIEGVEGEPAADQVDLEVAKN